MIMSADQACELITLIVIDILQANLTDQTEDWIQKQKQRAKGKKHDVVGISSNVLHTCVCAYVASQQPRPGEGLSTGGAHARQGV